MVYFLYVTLVVIGLVSIYSTAKNHPRLTAVSHTIYAVDLYHRLRNEDVPSKADPATSMDGQIRKDICSDITRNGFFHRLDYFPITNQEIRRGRNKSKYRFAIDLMFNLSLDYTNLYRQVHFDDGRMYVSDERTVPFYVTKEYNVGLLGGSYKPGRFIIASQEQSQENHRIGQVMTFRDIFLAEEPAKIFNEPDFNVELYYLQVKKYAGPVVPETIDPVCKLVSRNILDSDNPYNRLCTAASKLPDFKPETSNVNPVTSFDCKVKKVFFRTEDGKKESKGKSFNERLLKCAIEKFGSFYFTILYISRGYKSDEIFVYRQEQGNDKIYLENLSTNYNIIVDELNSFDFIED